VRLAATAAAADFLPAARAGEVDATLDKLLGSGLRLRFLSNFTPRIQEANLSRSGLADRFDRVVS
jgi:FMN phosphatase YigB (HAD superfamily)